jgi:hypothetical protein
VRETLQSALESGEKLRLVDPLFEDDAVFAGKTPNDLAKRLDEHLYGRGRNA